MHGVRGTGNEKVYFLIFELQNVEQKMIKVIFIKCRFEWSREGEYSEKTTGVSYVTPLTLDRFVAPVHLFSI